MAAFRLCAERGLYRPTSRPCATLTKKHGFALHPDDLAGIDYVYKTAFYAGGPKLSMNTQAVGRRADGRGDNSTYADIQSLHDGTGMNRGFLANEDNWWR